MTKKERSNFCTIHNSQAQNHFNLGLGPKISNNSNLAGQKNLHTIPYKVSSFNNVITVDKTNFVLWIQIVNFSPCELQRLPVVYQHRGKKIWDLQIRYLSIDYPH